MLGFWNKAKTSWCKTRKTRVVNSPLIVAIRPKRAEMESVRFLYEILAWTLMHPHNSRLVQLSHPEDKECSARHAAPPNPSSSRAVRARFRASFYCTLFVR